MTLKATGIARTIKRYERIAPFYDFTESPMEALRFTRWRSRLREKVTGKRALEVGVGTGKNILYYLSIHFSSGSWVLTSTEGRWITSGRQDGVYQ